MVSFVGGLDIAGVCVVAFGMILCVVSMPDNPDFVLVAAVLVFVCGLGVLFWVAPVVGRGWVAWPVRFPNPYGNHGAANGMIVWWGIVVLIVVVLVLGMWRGIDGLWFYVGTATTILVSVRVACAYTEHGWVAIRMKL